MAGLIPGVQSSTVTSARLNEVSELFGFVDSAVETINGLRQIKAASRALDGRFFLEFRPFQRPDRRPRIRLSQQDGLDASLSVIPLQLRVSTGADDSRSRVPPAEIFTATFPRVRLVDAQPSAGNPLPEYPQEERDDGRDGEVMLRVVVDERGAAVIRTLEVLHATSPTFALAAARVLARYHFAPAHVGSCPVPQVVEIPFWFSLRP